jgi:hypothetical protein
MLLSLAGRRLPRDLSALENEFLTYSGGCLGLSRRSLELSLLPRLGFNLLKAAVRLLRRFLASCSRWSRKLFLCHWAHYPLRVLRRSDVARRQSSSWH